MTKIKKYLFLILIHRFSFYFYCYRPMGLSDLLFDDADEAVVGIILQQLKNRKSRSRGGSKIGKSPNKSRDIAAGHRRIMMDYLAPSPVYSEKQFRRRYRMSSRLFRRLLREIPIQNSYFLQRNDATGKPGASPEQKITGALRMLAYGLAADAIDEYVRLSETTILLSMKEFCSSVIAVFGERYLRYPDSDDIKRIQAENSARGFPGMLGSIDCMHWYWKNCPKAWQGQMIGKDGEASLVLEAVATHDLHIWHAFFGMPGSCNDINILDRSPLISDIISGDVPSSKFSIGDVEFSIGYYLADGIYPPWSVFVQGYSQPDSQKKAILYNVAGVLQKRRRKGFWCSPAAMAHYLSSEQFMASKRYENYNYCLHYSTQHDSGGSARGAV